jgi:hypothetical protein
LAKELDEAVRAARGSIAGPLLDRITFGGRRNLLTRRMVRERRGGGTVDRSEVCCTAAPAVTCRRAWR